VADDARPVVIAVHGWEDADEPRFPLVVDGIRAAGIDVVDLYLPLGDTATMPEWCERVADAILALPEASDRTPMLMGYCLGGHLVIGALHHLERRGRAPGAVLLVDTWVRSLRYHLVHDVHGKFRLSWRRRRLLLLAAVAPPDPVRLRSVARWWTSGAVLRLKRFKRYGPNRRRRASIPNWDGAHVAYDGTFASVTTPARCVNSESSIADNEADPAMGLAPLLRGGFTLRIVPGGHHSMMEEPHTDGLVAALVDEIRR
jgi:thioesterase domain-containing protein